MITKYDELLSLGTWGGDGRKQSGLKKHVGREHKLSVSFIYVVPCHELCHLLDNSVPTSNNVRSPF